MDVPRGFQAVLGATKGSQEAQRSPKGVVGVSWGSQEVLNECTRWSQQRFRESQGVP